MNLDFFAMILTHEITSKKDDMELDLCVIPCTL